MKKEKNIDKTLLDMMVGIVLWGIISQAAGVWFVDQKAAYSFGLWIGIVLALGAAFHMWWALDRSLSFQQNEVVKVVIFHNIIRYMVIIATMGILMITNMANPLAAFLGVMGLKVSAYLQPFTHKVCSKLLEQNTKEL